MITGNAYQNFRRKFVEGCLSNVMRKCTKEGILQDLNEELKVRDYGNPISKRTFDEDWRFIKEETELAGITIKKWKEGKQCFYRYENPELSIFQEFRRSDIEKIARALHMLKQIKGIDLNDELFEVLSKIDSQNKYHLHKGKNVIDLQHVIASQGYEYVDDLYDAIIEETPVEFLYKPFREEARILVVHPYYLKQYNSRWFLFGFDESRNAISNIALDRISRKIKALQKTYILADSKFDANEYFKHIIGVTRFADRSFEDIILQFSSNRAPYVETKPLHATQEILQRDEDGSITVRLQLLPNFELESLILSFGKDIKVLQPVGLVNLIKEQAENIAKIY